MSISDNYIPVKESGNGVTTQFSANWNMIAESYARVYLEDKTTGAQTLQVNPTDYDIEFDQDGFTVTFVTAPSSDYWVVIGREVAIDQATPYKTSQGFDGKVTENSFDKLTAIAQDQQDELDRTPKFPLGSSFVGRFVDEPEDGRALIWDGDTGDIANGPTADEITSAQGYASSAAASAAAAQEDAENVALASIQIEAYVDAIAAILDGLSGQFGEIKHQIFNSPGDFTAGSTTQLTLNVSPIPTGEDQLDVYMYGTVGNGIRISSDNYTYNSGTGVITFSAAIPAGTTKVECVWVTSLSIGVPAADSVNWLTMMVSQGNNKIGYWNGSGDEALLDFVTAITGSPSDTQIPSEKAVTDYVTASDPFSAKLLMVSDQKAANTAGGTSVAGSFQTRVLNTTDVNDLGGTPLAANQITLAAGTYQIDGYSTFYQPNSAKIRLRNVTDGTTAVVGGNGYSSTSNNDNVIVPIKGRFTIAGSKVFELQYRVGNAVVTNGLGIAANFGEVEIYSQLSIWKIA